MQPRSKTSAPKGDINVTPLVDVVLVLLIIFMVITPMLQKGAEVKLPVVDNPEKAKDTKEQVTISVTKDGRLYWETDPVSETDMNAKLAATFLANPRPPIFVKGDVAASYGRVRAVMKMCNDAGFETVGLITKDRKEGS